MEKAVLWSESVKKAFYGYVAYLVLDKVIGPMASAGDMASNFASMAQGKGGGDLIGADTVVGILALAAFVYYFLGIKGMKESAVETALAEGTEKIYKGALLGIIGTVVGLIPLIGLIGGLVSLVGFIFMLMGFNSVRKTNLSAEAAKGAQQLYLTMVLTIVAAVVGLIPVLGGIIAAIISIITVIYAILGWKNFSLSTLE